MKTIKEMVVSALIDAKTKKVESEKKGYFDLWMLKNNFANIDFDSVEDFVKKELEKGYDLEDISIASKIDWSTSLITTFTNKISGCSDNSKQTKFPLNKCVLTKPQLLEVLALENQPILENRKKVLGNKQAALSFNFLQNNLKEMMVDQDTYDFILETRLEHERLIQAEKDRIRIENSVKDELFKESSLKTGSDYLKDLIKNNFNWLKEAKKEYRLGKNAKFLLREEITQSDNCVDVDEIKNPNREQLKKFIEYKKSLTDASVVRTKHEHSDEYGYKEERYFYRYFVSGNFEYPNGKLDEVLIEL